MVGACGLKAQRISFVEKFRGSSGVLAGYMHHVPFVTKQQRWETLLTVPL
jgi:hypothetical protein